MFIHEEITLKKLAVFLSFMQHGNLSHVADEMGQSNVSIHRALHSLEENLGCLLFKREGRTLVGLPTAHTLAPYAKKVLHHYAEGIQKTREIAGLQTTRLCIGSLYSLTASILPRLLMQLKTRQPEVDFDLRMGSNQTLLKDLEEGSVDAVVVALCANHNHQHWHTELLFEDSLYFAAPLNSPYATYKSIDLKALRNAQFVSLCEGFATTRDFNSAFSVAGYDPKISMRVDDIFSLINLVAGGMGYSLLPGRIASFSSRIQLIPLQAQYAQPQRIAVLLDRHYKKHPHLGAFVEECQIFSREKQNQPR